VWNETVDIQIEDNSKEITFMLYDDSLSTTAKNTLGSGKLCPIIFTLPQCPPVFYTKEGKGKKTASITFKG